MKTKGTLRKDIHISYRYVLTQIQRLEQLLTRKEKRDVRLKERDSTRATGLTADGKSLLPKVQEYLKKLNHCSNS